MTSSPRGRTPDQRAELSSEQSFPASDPSGIAAGTGARAVPAEEMLPEAGAPPSELRLERRFPDFEAAKLALESLVRGAPMDRQSAAIDLDGDGAVLRLGVTRAEATRLRGLLEAA